VITDVQVEPPRTRPHGPPSPGDIARRLTGRDYLSHSAISTYQRCPLKYYFSYVAGLAPEYVSSGLVFGGAIHSVLEHHCRRVLEGASLPSLDDLMVAYEQAWRNETRAPVRFGKTESAESLQNLARRMLAAFQASEVSKLDTGLLGIEEEIRAPVIPGCPDLLGRIDLVVLTGNKLKVTDFKTSRSRWTEAKIQESAPQMLLYAELVRPLAKELDVGEVLLEWVVITKAKQPAVEIHTLTPALTQIARTRAVVRRVWEGIKGGHFFPSTSSMACSSCPYSKACQQWEG
jgi:CRISPR/Cas system-associated exonuclease Cas4 (RecB family)